MRRSWLTQIVHVYKQGASEGTAGRKSGALAASLREFLRAKVNRSLTRYLWALTRSCRVYFLYIGTKHPHLDHGTSYLARERLRPAAQA